MQPIAQWSGRVGDRATQRARGVGSVGSHYSRYAIGEVLGIAAGFVSFPILSRRLSNYEFGVIGYLDLILLLAVAGLKFGIGDALLRFYPHEEGESGFRRFVSSLVLVPLAASFVIWLLIMGGLTLAVTSGWIKHGTAVLLAFAGIPFAVIASYVQWLMLAQERSGINVLTSTVGRWFQTILIIAFVLLLAPTASSVYLGRLLAAMAMTVWMVWWLCRQTRINIVDADLTLTRAALLYSLPLALNEISMILFAFADRWILNAILDDLALVGIYVIGSSLAMYVSTFVGATLGKSYTPALNRLYIQQGAAAVVAFKRQILVPMTYVVVLLAAGLLLTGHDFFRLVAGADKQASAPIFVMLSVTFVISTLFTIAGYGAILAKRTGLLLSANLIAVMVNVALDYLLIPIVGIMGCVYATMLAQVVWAAVRYLTCPPSLRCLPGGRIVLQSLMAASLAMAVSWMMLREISVDAPLVRLAVGGSVFVTLYLLPLLLLYPQLRKSMHGILSWRP